MSPSPSVEEERESSSHPGPLSRSKYPRALRLVRTVMGFTIILIGLFLAIPGIPGPGFLVIIGGLAILATEYVWARRYLNKIKQGGEKLGSIFVRKKKPTGGT
jgi:hypothetical protein